MVSYFLKIATNWAVHTQGQTAWETERDEIVVENYNILSLSMYLHVSAAFQHV